MEFVSKVCSLKAVGVVMPKGGISCKKMLGFIAIETEGCSFADPCCKQRQVGNKERDEEAC